MSDGIHSEPHNYGKGKCFAWLVAHMNYQGDDCLIWPFFRDPHVGRGKLGYKGKMWWAHRLMCWLVKGPPPTPKHQAAHSCGRGHHGCTNPNHLDWKTNSENQIDRWDFGNRQSNRGGPKGHLTLAQQAEIVALKGRKPQLAIAKQFGVSLGCVQYWHKYRQQRQKAA